MFSNYLLARYTYTTFLLSYKKFVYLKYRVVSYFIVYGKIVAYSYIFAL